MASRENHSVASELEGALLISRNRFPYFLLISLEAGGPLRALLLLTISPFLSLLDYFNFEELSLRISIFISTAGVPIKNLKSVAKATLIRFYYQQTRESVYRVFAKCGGKKYVISSMPRAMVEPFLKDCLGVDVVIATELRTFRGFSVGVAVAPEKFVGGGVEKFHALKAAVGDDGEIGLGIGDVFRDHPFMFLCKEIHLISPNENALPVPRDHYPKPLIFHDGRLVALPTPLDFLTVIMYLPLGIILAIQRMLLGLLPFKLAIFGAAITGLRVRAQFAKDQAHKTHGTLYASSHRTLLDPVLISAILQQKVSAVTYSLSRFSELISPIPTIRLTRDRSSDGAKMHEVLNRSNLVVCPEGTTCREPYLLRFSPLFAEIVDEIVPVAVSVDVSMFYGTTTTGYKCLDSLFFMMNPSPRYTTRFLDRVVVGEQGSSCLDVANYVQKLIGDELGYQCTNLTRRDKYRMLAGTDGVDSRK